MKKTELENGNLLREAVKKSNEIRNEENLTRVIQLLRDSHVWVPCIAKLGEEDQKQWEDKIMSGENLVGQTLTTKEEIHFKPDILQSGEDLFFPIFSNAEVMG
ncbi:MAG: SseB family protein, partial [Firmicutes bacterium]|nr:SseB family protein [Bacillota bacterium]